MKRILCFAMVAVAGLLAAGSPVKADHFRYVGHHHGGGYGGGYGGYNRGYSHYSSRPSFSVSFGSPVYRQSYGGYSNYGGGYGGGYGGYGGGYGVPVYSVPSYGYGGYGGGYCR